MQNFKWALLGLAIVPQTLAADTLSTNGFHLCMTDSAINFQTMDITYTRSTGVVVFDVAGTNAMEQMVLASISITAYGHEIYSKENDPCGTDIHVNQLCPVPKGTFKVSGSVEVPSKYASQIPGIAFNVPDLDGQAKLVLKSRKDQGNVTCLESQLTNGHSTSVGAVKYATAGIAAGALALSGVSAMSSVGVVGSPTSGPGFGDVMGWFHSMATNGMLSVAYPQVYRSFSSNFMWSTCMISWPGLLKSIDKFRGATGGNLTVESYELLKKATMMRKSFSSTNTTKRSWEYTLQFGDLVARSAETDDASSSSSESSASSKVNDLKQVAQELMIPSADVFMNVLLIFAIVIAAVVVGILLMKVVLELWALYGKKFPEQLAEFRKDYWGLMARTITNMILVLYSIWVLYCVYQLRKGDSWGAKLLAALTLTLFTGLLVFFAIRIAYKARKYKKIEGDTSHLYEDRETWKKYSMFYDGYKKDFWWIFMPVIAYSLVKSCIIAGGEGHGMFQSAGQLVCEVLLLALLVVRVLSIACVLIFVEELGISQTTKTVTGIVLIVVQSTLTAVLAILIAVNTIIIFSRENPHAKQRREAEKATRDFDDLTPLDARDSLLMDHPQRKEFAEMNNFNFTGPHESYQDEPRRARSPSNTESAGLVHNDYGVAHGRSTSADSHGLRGSIEGRHPTAPGYGMAYKKNEARNL
ncbi:hypothetical protein PDIDSM_7731 [Penicillium digitatum]|nr:hypothetical protein PDIDSM_7731 [Penicillium digitatum]